MPKREKIELTNEQLVLIWLAHEQHRRRTGSPHVRRHHPSEGPDEFTMHEIEDQCWSWWQQRGARCSRATLVRAAFRVMGPPHEITGTRDGSDPRHLLGSVEARRPPKTRFLVFRYSKSPSELLTAAGEAWESIPHARTREVQQ